MTCCKLYEYPFAYYCPISKELMKDPVSSVKCDHSYERKNIVKWLETDDKCPRSDCEKELKVEDLRDNTELKSIMDATLKVNM